MIEPNEKELAAADYLVAYANGRDGYDNLVPDIEKARLAQIIARHTRPRWSSEMPTEPGDYRWRKDRSSKVYFGEVGIFKDGSGYFCSTDGEVEHDLDDGGEYAPVPTPLEPEEGA